MRKLIIPFIIPIVIFSCKKENVNPDEVRLQRVESYNASGLTGSTVFNYNQQGQITSISSVTPGGATSVAATIVYNGSNIIITPAPINSAGVDASFEIRYTLNTAGQPLQKIERTTFSFKPPNNPQYDLKIDTTNYEYSGDFLVKTKGSSYDSGWSSSGTPQSVQISITREISNATYTNTGNKLTQINSNTTSTHKLTNNNGTNILQSTETATTTFGYTKGYANKTDFTNAVVLSQFGALLVEGYPINKAYDNFPDQVVYSSTYTTIGTGQSSSNTGTTNATVSYNRYGFISSVDFGQQYLKNVVYNK